MKPTINIIGLSLAVQATAGYYTRRRLATGNGPALRLRSQHANSG